MTPDELSRIREIYEAALVLSVPCGPFLDAECRGDVEIRAEVERLLAAHARVPDWLDQPAAGVARPFVPLLLPNMEGRRLSGYTILREIGRGGMGAVYLAERSDGAFQKQVAIKLVLPAGDNAEVIARFQQEREIQASLDHPNIAKLLDGGMTDEGWPYFVMEFVDGQPIHRWCDDRKLNVSQRLELFRGVIAAVRYAHQRMVVHRDLKPNNIFVTQDGNVKLLDFGIARVLVAPNSREAAETQTLARMMTPEYASPEQVNGEAITTLTDIYSLGVTLYELLTGHRPYRLLSAAMHEMARVIAEVEPTRPSEVVATTESGSGSHRAPITPDTVSAVREGDPARLRKRLVGDLDSILLMALQKEPGRRYGSVEALGEDLERHLEQRPVAARKATPWDRFNRFRRRNPGAFAGAGLTAILFVAGIAAVALQARHAVLAAGLAPGAPFLAPLWMFSSGIAVAAVCLTYYLAAPNRAEWRGAVAGGLVWGLCMLGRPWIERSMGLWRSRIEGIEDPLQLFSPWTFFLFPLMGVALLLALLLIKRRFGWRGQALSLVVLGFYQAIRERLWFGEFIPAVAFQPGVTTTLIMAAMVIAIGLIGLAVMRLVSGPDRRADRE